MCGKPEAPTHLVDLWAAQNKGVVKERFEHFPSRDLTSLKNAGEPLLAGQLLYIGLFVNWLVLG